MVRIVILFSILCLLFSCSWDTKKGYNEINEQLIIGLWQSKDQEAFLIFNDSLCLPNVFYPYTKWKIKKDTLFIYDLESARLDDSLWFTYKIKKLSSDTLHMENLDSAILYNDILFLKEKLVEEKFYVNQLRLEVASCAFDDNCKELGVKVDLVQGKVLIENFEGGNDSTIAIECSLSREELRILKIMLNELKLEEIRSSYISNVMHAKYFNLEVELRDNEENVKTLIDSGSKAPKSLEKIVTYVLAVSQLKCRPEKYFESLYHY